MLLDLLCQVASDPGQHLLLEDCSVEVTVKCGHIELVHSGGPDLLGLIKKTLEGLTSKRGWSQSEGGQPHPNTCAAWLWASSHLLKNGHLASEEEEQVFQSITSAVVTLVSTGLDRWARAQPPILRHDHGPYTPARGRPGQAEQLNRAA